MTDLNHLRNESEKALYGLKADETLKYRILQNAAAEPERKTRKSFQLIPVMCVVAAALLFSVLLLNGIPPVSHPEAGNINVFTAGGDPSVSSWPDRIGQEKIVSIEPEDRSPVLDQELCASLIEILRTEAVKMEKLPDPFSSAKTMIVKTESGEQFLLSVSEPYIWFDNVSYECPGFFEKLALTD